MPTPSRGWMHRVISLPGSTNQARCSRPFGLCSSRTLRIAAAIHHVAAHPFDARDIQGCPLAIQSDHVEPALDQRREAMTAEEAGGAGHQYTIACAGHAPDLDVVLATLVQHAACDEITMGGPSGAVRGAASSTGIVITDADRWLDCMGHTCLIHEHRARPKRLLCEFAAGLQHPTKLQFPVALRGGASTDLQNMNFNCRAASNYLLTSHKRRGFATFGQMRRGGKRRRALRITARGNRAAPGPRASRMLANKSAKMRREGSVRGV